MIIDSHSEGTLADKDLGIGISHGKVTYSELVVNINKPPVIYPLHSWSKRFLKYISSFLLVILCCILSGRSS